MQKKLLLLCVMVNCAMMQASEPSLDYKDYTEQKTVAYQAALINALSGDGKALEKEDHKSREENDQEAKANEQANKDEEECRKKEYFDGEIGWLGSQQPTTRSKVGRKFQEYAQYRAGKDAEISARKENKNKIWREISQEAAQKQKIFNEKVLLELAKRLEADRYFLHTYCVSAFQKCGKEEGKKLNDCFDEKGISPTIFTNSHFETSYEDMLYKCIAQFSREQGAPVTPEELKIIAERNEKTKVFFKELQSGANKITTLREEILNPEKRIPIIEIDITKDQNDQGALSQ
jgi:hypothetical protein